MHDLKAVIAALREAGVTEVLLKISSPTSIPDSRPLEAPTIASEAPAYTSPPPSPNQEATDRVQRVIEQLKLKDEDLLNEIFPEGAGL